MENTFFENLKKQSYSFFRGEQRGIAFLLVFFLTLSFTACDGFFTDNNLEEKISAAIAYENAQNISVTVAPENVLHGRVTTGSPVSAKIGYPFNINFIVDSAYTFGG